MNGGMAAEGKEPSNTRHDDASSQPPYYSRMRHGWLGYRRGAGHNIGTR